MITQLLGAAALFAAGTTLPPPSNELSARDLAPPTMAAPTLQATCATRCGRRCSTQPRCGRRCNTQPRCSRRCSTVPRCGRRCGRTCAHTSSRG
ncbi:MAG TPA: hypothetical protein VK188_11545 [Holophaga sp.]|nr:hypothetical protein [Holophaga sp.]